MDIRKQGSAALRKKPNRKTTKSGNLAIPLPAHPRTRNPQDQNSRPTRHELRYLTQEYLHQAVQAFTRFLFLVKPQRVKDFLRVSLAQSFANHSCNRAAA